MESIDFEEITEEPHLGYFTKGSIENINKYIGEKNLDELKGALTKLETHLIEHCENERIKFENYSYENTAKGYFSQYLQYIFHYTLKTTLDLNAKSEIVEAILANHGDSFYYRFGATYEKPVTLWIDKLTGDTALTIACQRADADVLEKLLENLSNAFVLNAEDDEPPNTLQRYLLHENKLGRSALTSIWLRQEAFMEDKLFNFATIYYKNKFDKFIFQVDSEGNTALMRAVTRDLSRLFTLIINNVARIYPKRSYRFQKFLLQKNNEGENIVHKLIQMQQVPRIKEVLHEAAISFDGVDNLNFKRFISLEVQAKKIPLIEAVKLRNKEIINVFLSDDNEGGELNLPFASELLMQQDSEGYSALMRSVELNYREGFERLLNVLVRTNCTYLHYACRSILRILYLKNQQGHSVFQLAAKASNWELLEDLIDVIDLIAPASESSLMLKNLNRVDENGVNLLTRIYREERAFGMLSGTGKRLSTKERKDSARRLKLARSLARLGEKTSGKAVVPYQKMPENQPWFDRIINFFSIFCSPSSYSRLKRSGENACFLSERDYKPSLPENRFQRRQEALINVLTFIKQKDLDSINEVRLIRNLPTKSEREHALLEEFSQAVTRYYDAYGVDMLAKLKEKTALNLEAAFAENQPYILLDNGHDFLVLQENELFDGALLNSVKSYSLDPLLSRSALKAWLGSYFGSSYTLHPFDAEAVSTYPDFSGTLEKPIHPDATLLARFYEGVKCQTLRELFLLDGKSIDLSKFTYSGLFTKDKSRVGFRADRFHEIFFELDLSEQRQLLWFIQAYQFPVTNYPKLSRLENEYLAAYAVKLNALMDQGVKISPVGLVEIAIAAHEEVLTRETVFEPSEKKHIISELRGLKSTLTLVKSGAPQVALQLLVLLLPTTIRAVANKDPLALAAPVGLIASDVALREVLLRLVRHPQAMEIFSAGLARKILGMVGQTTEKIPVVGSALAIYGLIQSGKALIHADSKDPNRSYYAHLLMNNLATVGLMGAEVAVSLPFWPVLGLFAILTVDQTVTEGGRIHDSVLHLEDDQAHPLLKFYRNFKLGLSLSDDAIQIIVEQRELFKRFLNYVEGANNKKNAAALVAVSLPEIRRIEGPREIQRQTGLGEGCLSTFPPSSEPRVYPESPICRVERLVVDAQADYSFELGQVKTFCEKRDLFYVEQPSNYTLLVGTQSKDCSLGRETTVEAVAQASGSNAAGILVNRQFRETNSSGDYPLFLPIDPRYIRNYTFKFLERAVGEQRPVTNTSLAAWLLCADDTVHCIKQVKVLVTSLFSIAPSDLLSQTHITINDDALRNSTLPQGVTQIEYLLGITKQVRIEPNQIPEQRFVFFKDAHYLKFENNSIKSEEGFYAPLTAVKKLTLEFSEKAWIEGYYQAPLGQQLLINQLKGSSEEKRTVIELTQLDRFSISFGQHTQVKYQALEISLEGNFTDTALEVYRHHKNESAFYHFLKPMNKIHLVSRGEAELILSLTDSEKQETVQVKIKNSIVLDNESLHFSGKYLWNDEVFFSHIRMHRPANLSWECNLEIDASTAKTNQSFYRGDLQSHQFDKVSILTKVFQSCQTTHYLFYQSKALPVVSGKFVDYRLIDTVSGWLVILKHIVRDEETRCFVGENTREIIIDSIRYQLRPSLATLFALGSVDNTPMDGKNLIAPLKIESTFSESNISLVNDTYEIGNVSFKHLPLKTKLYFLDQTLPFAYLVYKLGFNQNDSVLNRIPGNYLDGRQFIETKAAIKNRVEQEGFSSIQGFFTGVCLATLTLAGGIFFGFTKRFKRPTLHASAPLGLTVLEIPKASPLFQEEKWIPDALFQSNSANLPPNPSTEKNSVSSVNYTSDLNTQLIFSHYLVHFFKKHSNKRAVLNSDRFYNRLLSKPSNLLDF